MIILKKEERDKGSIFDNLTISEPFSHNGGYYIRTNQTTLLSGISINAVNLKTGCLKCFNPSDKIERVNLVGIIE